MIQRKKELKRRITNLSADSLEQDRKSIGQPIEKIAGKEMSPCFKQLLEKKAIW